MNQENRETRAASELALNRQRRRFVFEQLFMCQFYESEEAGEQLDNLAADEDLLKELQEGNLPEAEREILKTKALQIMSRRAELDGQIDAVATGWKTTRMGRAELSLLRQALYDMLYDDTIPYRVAINEAVELAKLYGGNEAPGFVNAVLGKLVGALGLES